MDFQKFISKKIELRYALLLILLFILFLIIYGNIVRHNLLVKNGYGKVGNWAVNIASIPSNIKAYFKELRNGKKSPYYIENNTITANGLRFYSNQRPDSAYLLSCYYSAKEEQAVIELIDLKNGSVTHKWIPPIDKISHDLNKSEARINHPYLNTDGSIIAQVWGNSMFKIDSSSNLIWTTNGYFHHSIECDIEGNIITCGRIEPNFSKVKFTNYLDDAIIKLNPDGKVIYRKSIIELLLENNRNELVFGIGIFENDPIHVNEIRPVPSNSVNWQKGDLLISLRHKSTVMVYRPQTNKIIWLKSGPWINQHDPEIVDSDKISVFGNDLIRDNTKNGYNLYGHNNFYIYSFITNNIDTFSYHNSFIKSNIRSIDEGRARIIANGNVFVDENNNGRSMVLNNNGPVWEYYNRINDKYVAMTFWNRYMVKKGECKFCLFEN